MLAIRTFTAFDTDNDPYHERDFGSIEEDGVTYYFKIDYYNLTWDGGSEDPDDPDVTKRVMTVMRADEY